MTEGDGAPSPATASRPRRKKRGRWLNSVEYFAMRALVAFGARIPHGWMVALGAAGGAIYGGFSRWFGMRDHSVATANLALAFPEKSPEERDAILRRTWRNWGRMVADAIHLTRMTPEELRKLVRVEPEEHYRDATEKVRKRGVLVLTAHFGSFEMLHAAMSAHGHPVSLVHRTMANPAVNDWLHELRAKFGTRALARGRAAREILTELREGRPVAIPFDQAAHRTNRVFLPFFGIPASTNSGLARLAQTSRAPIYPVVLIREGTSLRHRVCFGPEIELVKTEDREADQVENSRRFNRVLEQLIRDHPDHWIWMYRRWKQQPEGLSSPYQPGAPAVEVYRAAAAKL